MKTLFQILTCLALLFPSLTWSQSTINLRPDYDAALGYHDGFNTATQNYGTAIQNDAFCIPGASGGLNKNRALLHFDLSQIAPGTTIRSATLDLYALGASGTLNGHTGTANQSYLQQVTSAWQEMSVTWNTQPGYSSLNQVTLHQSNSQLEDYLGTDVTALVQDMINNPTTNYGFGLILQNEVVTNALTFCSNDHPDTTKRPMLHVTLCPDSVVLVADYDAAIGTHHGLGTSGNNYGTAPQNAAYCITATDGTPSGNTNRALIHFDLSSIGNAATVQSATLNLYARGPNGTLNGHTGTANQSYLRRITDPWTVNTVTWDNQPASTLTDAVLLQQSTSPLQDYTFVDVTTLVQDMLASTNSNNGFMLQLATEVENNGLIFQSLDCGIPGKFPTLTVHLICSTEASVKEGVRSNTAVSLFPNPTDHALNLSFELPEAAPVSVMIFDMNGRTVGKYDGGVLPSGPQTITLDHIVAGFPAGMYIARVGLGERMIDKKLILTAN